MTSDAPKPQPPPQKPIPAKPSVGSQLKNKASESPSSSQGTSTPSGEKSGSGPTKPRSGGIMQSFAKAAASKADPKRKPASQPAQNSAAKTPSTAMMSDDDDGEEDDHSGVLPQPKASGDSAEVRKARAEREAELKRMMEDDEEDEAEEARSSPDEDPEEPLPDAEATESKEEGDKPSQEQEDSQPSELVSSSGDGRKRGKRKVIKKRQVQDDEGYFGRLSLCGLHHYLFSSVANLSCQSRYGKPPGSPSLRTKLHRRKRPRRRRLLVQEELRRQRNPRQRAREISCRSSARNRDGM